MEVTDLSYIDATGFHSSDYPTWLAWIKSKYQGIYGADVYLGEDSQDGQWLAILAQAFYDTQNLAASVFNSFSPATAQGLGLSRVVKINGIRRRIATYSTVDLAIGGTIGTTIVNGVAIDTLNQKWNLPASVTIPSAGTILVTAISAVVGAVEALPGTVNAIFTPTQGWQTVTNASVSQPGAAIETDAELRMRQVTSVALPSLTVLEGMTGAVANVTGVTNVKGYENYTKVTDANGLPGNCTCHVVEGGDATQIATAIAQKKTPGVATFGTTSVPVVDAKGLPITIQFTRPTIVEIKVTVTIAAGPGYSSNYAASIKQAIADVINGNDIADTVLITKLYYPAYLNGAIGGTTYSVTTITIGKDMGAQGSVNIPLAYNELAHCDPTTDITLVVT